MLSLQQKETLINIPTYSNKEKNPYIRPREAKKLLYQRGKAGPIYTIWGAAKPVMIQLKASNIPPENMPGLHEVKGAVAQLSHPYSFRPGFMFSWKLEDDLLVLIFPTRANQSARRFPSDFNELCNNYTVIAYDLEGRHTSSPKPFLNDTFFRKAA